MENDAAAIRLTVESKINKRLIKLQEYRHALSTQDAQSATALGTVRLSEEDILISFWHSNFFFHCFWLIF